MYLRLNHWFIKPLFLVENQVELSYLSSSGRNVAPTTSSSKKNNNNLQTKQISAAPPQSKEKNPDFINNIPTTIRACILMFVEASDFPSIEDSFNNFPRPVMIVIFCPSGTHL